MPILEFKKENKDFYSTEMEIFASGIHNGDKYKNKDLDIMVEAFNALKSKWKPPLKLGHGKQLAEQPALGYVDKLKRTGNKLIAIIVDIPKIVKEAIEKGLYKKRSAEVYWDFKEGNKVWPRCLKAVALLGANIPAVSSLKDIEKFFDVDNNDTDIKIYEMIFEEGLNDCEKDEGNNGEVKNYMYWSETKDFIKARIKNMDLFIFSTLKEDKFEGKDGIIMISGVLESAINEDRNIQSWVFDRKIWTKQQAQSWLEGYGHIGNYKYVSKEKNFKQENENEKNVKEKKKGVVMDYEKIIKELNAKIEQLTEKLSKYAKNESSKEIEGLKLEVKKKNEELETMKAFKVKADALKKERDDAIAQADIAIQKVRKDSIANFVKEYGVTGAKKILPRDVKLVEDILEACSQEKKYKFKDEDISLEGMVKEFIKGLPELIDIGQISKKDDNESHGTATSELNEKIIKYQQENKGADYGHAYKSVLEADADLKERYHKERM